MTLETGELATYDNVRASCLVAGAAGRWGLHQDFHRQGLARRYPAGNPRDAAGGPRLVHRHRRTAGVKPAGGIRTTKDAVRYLVAVRRSPARSGSTPSLFRFGASSLLNDLLLQRRTQLPATIAARLPALD